MWTTFRSSADGGVTRRGWISTRGAKVASNGYRLRIAPRGRPRAFASSAATAAAALLAWGLGTHPATGDPGGAAPSARGDAIAFLDAGQRDPARLWGKVDCATTARVQVRRRRATRGRSVLGRGIARRRHRRLRVVDGDDVFGERCELGLNDHRAGPTALYTEGQRLITAASIRLARSYPLRSERWQAVMQMKQTQPSANGGGTPVLALHARDGRWVLTQSASVNASSATRVLWRTRAERLTWTRIRLDVTYSQNPGLGSVSVRIDGNGDGDARDRGERSPTIHTYTLKRERSGGSASDGIPPGASIPSHLRLGVYHDPSLRCPPPEGCGLDLDDVVVRRR